VKIYRIAYFILLSFYFPVKAQILFPAGGDWYVVKVEKDGVYQVNRDFFISRGVDISGKNPDEIRFFTTKVKQLPQRNSVSYDIILQEIPVETNNTDNVFDRSDYIRFYAEGPNRIFQDSSGSIRHELHQYDRFNTVFVQTGSGKSSIKIDNSTFSSGQPSELKSLVFFEYYEPETTNLLNSGREWLGEYFFSEWKKRFQIDGLVKGETALLETKVVGQTYENTQLDLLYKNQKVGSTPLRKITYRWNDSYRRYDRVGEISRFSATFNIAEDNPEFTFRLPSEVNISSGVYLDFLEFTAKREIRHYAGQTFGYLPDSGYFRFSTLINDPVWDVTDATLPVKLSRQNNDFVYFSSGGLKRLLFFSSKNVLEPVSIKKINPLNISNLSTPDLLIIYPKLFEKEVERLAEFRRTSDKLEVLTFELEDVFNHYSGGKNDPTAIRNLCRALWSNNSEKFRYLLLFGDATFDPKNNNNLGYVRPEAYIPTYESKESLEPIYSYSSDDYFGFLEHHEGEWPEGYSEDGRWISNREDDHTLDIAVGRLPVKDRIEASLLVDKLIDYSSSKSTFGNWKRNVTFVADDGDRNRHQLDGEVFSSILTETNAAASASKIYIDAFPHVVSGTGERVPEANKKFEEDIKNGVLVVNFNGHGSVDGWTDEKILTLAQIQRWQNKDRLPVFLTATCEFGRFDNPSVVSGAELTLLNPDGGAIALMTTTRPVFASTNDPINRAFYRYLFEDRAKGIRLGDVFRKTKNAAVIGEINRNFSLLGDPSLKINYPEYELFLTEVNGNDPSDAIVNYRSKITLKGRLVGADFSGKVQISVYDKAVRKETLGSGENLKMTFQSVENKLFEGLATLKNGFFETSFILPESNDLSESKLHIYLYAINSDSTQEALGSSHVVTISGLNSQSVKDMTPPEASLVYEKSTGSIEIRLSDESGIFLSSNDPGNSIILIINDTLEVILNPYYLADESGRNGNVSLLVGQLAAGKHTMVLKVSDVYTNRKTHTFEFTVASEPFKIELLNLEPNPSDGLLNAEIGQNAIGENVEMELRILDYTGKVFGKVSRTCYECGDRTRISTNLESFLSAERRYIYNIRARAAGSKAESSVSGHLLFWK
jgi:hypothetical protein